MFISSEIFFPVDFLQLFLTTHTRFLYKQKLYGRQIFKNN